MIYIKKCVSSENSTGASRNEILRTEAYSMLCNALVQKGIPKENQELIRNQYGKPTLKQYSDIHFNISHCKGLAMCVITDSEIGADVENIRHFPERVMKRCFTEREIQYVLNNETPEKAFFQLWTLKESYVKAIGIGISYPMKKAEFIIENNSIIPNTEKHFEFTQIIIDNEFVCSVCCDNGLNNRICSMSYKEQFPLELFK